MRGRGSWDLAEYAGVLGGGGERDIMVGRKEFLDRY
jgi:hypothetical protein